MFNLHQRANKDKNEGEKSDEQSKHRSTHYRGSKSLAGAERGTSRSGQPSVCGRSIVISNNLFSLV